MCDFQSALSAFADLGSVSAGRTNARAQEIAARAESIDLKSKGEFEAAQLEAFGVLTRARASYDMAGAVRDYGRQMRANAAAAAFSGFAGQSFRSIAEGNDAELARNLRDIDREARLTESSLKSQARVTRADGGRAGQMALLAGVSKAASTRAEASKGVGRAVNTMLTAEKNYQQYNTGETRMQSFFKSMGA